MMMATTVKLKIVRPMLWAGTSRARNGSLWADAVDAAKLISSGAAVLANPSDITLLIDAENDSLAARHDCMTFRPKAWVTR